VKKHESETLAKLFEAMKSRPVSSQRLYGQLTKGRKSGICNTRNSD